VIRLPDHFQRDIEPLLDVGKTKKEELHGTLKLVGVTLLGVLLSLYFIFNVRGVHWLGINQEGLAETIAANDSDYRYRRAMAWATGVDANGNENMPAGRIFNANWDDFPKLFFLNTKHSYVYGLDPNYLYSANPDLYKLLLDITNGKTEDAAPLIRERFGAEYVFADAKENEDMFAKLLESGWVDMIYEDDEARILKIREVKGSPPRDAADEEQETEEEKQILDEEESNSGPNTNAGNANTNIEDEETND
jgi:hypothetical protein